MCLKKCTQVQSNKLKQPALNLCQAQEVKVGWLRYEVRQHAASKLPPRLTLPLPVFKCLQL